jgi:hypothetical protein
MFTLPHTLFIYTFIRHVQRHLALYNGITPQLTVIFRFLSNPQHLIPSLFKRTTADRQYYSSDPPPTPQVGFQNASNVFRNLK